MGSSIEGTEEWRGLKLSATGNSVDGDPGHSSSLPTSLYTMNPPGPD